MNAIKSAEAQKTYEAWLNRQPTEDLREFLTDPELSPEDRELIAALVELRKTHPREMLTDIDFLP